MTKTIEKLKKGNDGGDDRKYDELDIRHCLKSIRIMRAVRRAYEAGYDDDTLVGDILDGKTPHQVMVERMNKPDKPTNQPNP